MRINYIYSENKQIVMTTFNKSREAKNLQADPKVILLIDPGNNYRELKSLIFNVEAEIDSDQTAIRKIMEKQNFSPIHKKVLLRFSPDSSICRNHTNLNDQY